MRFSGVSALAIWNAATRSLTNIGSGALVIGVTANGTLAASATVDFRPTTGKVAFTSLAVVTIAAGGAAIQLNDGTNTVVMVTVGATSTGFIADVISATSGAPSVGLQLKNTTVTAGTYMAANMNWVQ